MGYSCKTTDSMGVCQSNPEEGLEYGEEYVDQYGMRKRAGVNYGESPQTRPAQQAGYNHLNNEYGNRFDDGRAWTRSNPAYDHMDDDGPITRDRYPSSLELNGKKTQKTKNF